MINREYTDLCNHFLNITTLNPIFVREHRKASKQFMGEEID